MELGLPWLTTFLIFAVDDRSVTVASHAKSGPPFLLIFSVVLNSPAFSSFKSDDFLLGKPHKEVAALMLQLVEDEASTEQQIIKVRLFFSSFLQLLVSYF